VDNLLDASNNLNALLHHIHVLICTTAHGEDTSKHLQEARVGTRGGGTPTTGSARRSHSWWMRGTTMKPRILGSNRAKRVMSNILVEPLMSHYLNHVLNIGSKSTRSSRVGGDVPNLIHDVLKHIEPLILHMPEWL
jgi:hypothetical protein